MMSIPGLGHSDFFQGLTGETAAQRAVRHAGEAKRQDLLAGNTGQGDDASSASAEAAAKQSAAADKLTAAADKLSAAAAASGSITGKPLTPGAHH
jgi:hypothetical protein